MAFSLCIRTSLALWLGLLLTSTVAAGRPNVVLIMTDNHGAWTLGCYGNQDIRTPHIDRMAAEGTLFTRAFASNPVCSPTRATFLTGLVPSQHGVHSYLAANNLQIGPDARNTLAEFTSLPEVLREAGYACGLVGKWHLGDNLKPQEGLDDYWITMPHGGTSTFYDAPIIQNGKIRKEPTYLTDFWTQHAVKFIEQQADSDKPFFLFLSYNGPYALGRLLLRDGRNRHAEYYADQPLESFPRTQPHPWQLNNLDFINNPTSIRRVATEVSGVDDGVGTVMQALRQQGIDDDTIVIFVADQGWVGGQGGFFGMGDHTRPLTARDGMMQIPMIWRHPGKIAAGQRRDQLIANYDLMPTLLGHLGLEEKIPTSPRLPGNDYSPLLGSVDQTAAAPGDRQQEDDAVFYEYENLRCIRTATHKYVHRHPNGPHELYDLQNDPQEFNNLAGQPSHGDLQGQLKGRLDRFYQTYALPKYDMWNGGTSQVRIHEGIEEAIAKPDPVQPPPLPDGFQPAPIELPEGYEAELVAGPPLVTHPTMACFDESGALYVCNNAGVNMRNNELEEKLPNAIRRLVDRDGDGVFDSMTVFADKMTFPMGGTFHNGSLYVASPPSIWRLTDTDGDGVADERTVLVDRFGYTGNAASIHGCFFGPDGRLHWTDGHHGHQFKDKDGQVTSQRDGSYLFSCRPDGSDVRIHCGGGMDNPVEVDFTDSGDMLGNVNILYTRPRVDCLVHWLHGGAYPHRQRILEEIKVTGELLTPMHRFGHVAVSGVTRYRSGVLDHRLGDDWFVTFFNSGKVVRLEVEPEGSTYAATQHEFLSSPSRDFHPTDVLEDADGSLLVVDTGGWFYNGCPTSQFAKPDVLGGIYRIKRTGMTTVVDPRGERIDWESLTPAGLLKQFNDGRPAVREQAIHHCVQRGAAMIPQLRTRVARSDIRLRRGAVWALTRMGQNPDLASAAMKALRPALSDTVADIRQAACYGMSFSATTIPTAWLEPLLQDDNPAVRRQAAVSLGQSGDASVVTQLLRNLNRQGIDRSEEHALIYAMIEIGDVDAIQQALEPAEVRPEALIGALTAIDQINSDRLTFQQVVATIDSGHPAAAAFGVRVLKKHPDWYPLLANWLAESVAVEMSDAESATVDAMLDVAIASPDVSRLLASWLSGEDSRLRQRAMQAIARAGRVDPGPQWIEPLQQQLASGDPESITLAVAAASSLAGNPLESELTALADDVRRSPQQRADALAAIAAQTGKISDAVLDSLLDLFLDSGSPAAADRAAQILGSARLSAEQAQRLSPVIRQASPAQLRDVIRVFHRRSSPAVANAFLDAIEQSRSWRSLAVPELSDVIKRFPKQTLARGNRLLDQLKSDEQQKLVRLHSLRDRLGSGDVGRGKSVFQSEKAKCQTCHRVGESGKAVGPDLTTIGGNRAASDLIESILFPSASIVRDYQTYQVLTLDGRAVTGLVAAETADTVSLQQASGETVEIRRDDIDQMITSPVSVMPAGLDEALSEQDLIDVVKYLQSLK